MPTTRSPRHGSLQYWPRKRAKRMHARVRSWANQKNGKPLGFAGFKAGMTHVIVTDNGKTSPTKGQDIVVPVTILECPPLKVAGVRFYAKAKKGYGTAAATEVRFKADKFLAKRTKWSSKTTLDKIKPEEYEKAVLLVHTQPNLTGIGQKAPQIFEVAFGGSVEDVIAYAKENKEIAVDQVFEEGQFVDTHSVSTGKGTQGPVKRFGITLRSHRSEKSRRRAVLGTMTNAKVEYSIPQQGQMGTHLRTEYNKKIIAMKPAEEVQVKGGIVNFGNVKNTVVLVKGGVAGTKKRLVTFTAAIRPDPKASTQAPALQHIATRSQQGNQ